MIVLKLRLKIDGSTQMKVQQIFFSLLNLSVVDCVLYMFENYARQLNQYKNNRQKQQQLTIYFVKPYNRSEMVKQLLT